MHLCTHTLICIGANEDRVMEVGRPSRKAAETELDKRKQKQLENLLDDGPTVRTSLVFPEDLHRRYKVFLAQNKKTIKDDLLAYVEECVKDIP